MPTFYKSVLSNIGYSSAGLYGEVIALIDSFPQTTATI